MYASTMSTKKVRRTGSGGAARGGGRRGRGRARGGSRAAKDKTGGRGSAGNKTERSSSPVDSDCVNIIANLKDDNSHPSTSSHFNRQPNGSLNPSTLRLGGIPRRPHFAGPSASSSTSRTSISNNNSNNAVNLNNGALPGPGSDYYLHKKFKKVTATVEPGEIAPNESASTSSSSTSTTNGMVYKPKFRIKSDLEVAEEEVKVESSSASLSLIQSPSTSAVNLSVKQSVSVDLTSSSNTAGSSSTQQLTLYPVNSSLLVSSSGTPPVVSSCPNSRSSFTVEPAKINKEMRIDRKSLDDRISKIIDENQSILEWPEQFTKRLKNHTGRGGSQQQILNQNSLQRTSHLLSGGSTVELSCSSSSASLFTSSQMSHHPRNGLLRHHSSSSSSDGMSTSGGSVELVVNNQITSSPLHLPSTATLLKPTYNCSLPPTDLSFGAQQHEVHHHHHHNGSGGIVTSTVTNSPSVSPAFTSSTSSTTTTTSTTVPKKRRRLSPTPSRLCGGEVSELPVNQSGTHGPGEKGYFQDMDMTVRVSNCGSSGAKVTIRTNKGAISGGSVVDYPKIMEASLSPAMQSNGAIFLAGPGPSSPVPLSLVTSKKQEASLLSPSLPSDKTQLQKPPKSPRSRPTKSKKFQLETTSTTTTTSVSYSSASLLKLAHPQPQLSELKLSSANPPPIPGPASLMSPGPSSSINHSQVQEPTTARAIQINVPSASTPTKSENSDPVNKPNDPTKDLGSAVAAPLTVVPTNISQNPKRPTFLALKPVNTISKKNEPGVLPSPETPRVAKPYNQMTLNGQAYTYLGFKVSTRSSYTCLFKTQPMFIPQESDPKLSMYTNWQPRPRVPNQLEIGISTNDSRVNGRKSPHHILYTSAIGKGLDTMTVSSPDNQPPISSPICEQKTFVSGLQQQGPQVSVIPSSSSSIDQVAISKPLQVQVSPTQGGTSSGIAPPSVSPSSSSFCHSPPASSSLISRQSSVNSGVLMSVASSLSPNPIMATSTKQAKRMATPPSCGGSDTSSAEESGDRRRLNSNASEGPLPLTRKQMCEISREQRVKIMEGGFESNEDYTYVRGRGKGRYVCEACGIRCKKPSMLRKHLKTHTDLRPYTCKLCNFSFKTKGNLTKHQKSKSHHKKCAGLGIHPESSRSLAVTGPGAFSISDTNTTDDNESDDDMDDDNGNLDEATDSQEEIEGDEDTCSITGSERRGISGGGNGSFEKEIAQSLLDLSKATFQPRIVSHGSASMASGSDYESSGDQNGGGTKKLSYPFNSVIEDISNSSVGSGSETQGGSAPIDLSVKPTTSGNQRFQTFEQNAKRIKLEEASGTSAGGAEKWEPPADEEAMMGVGNVVSGDGRCFNLKTVLSRNSIAEGSVSSVEGPSELFVRKMTDVKTEVPDYPDSSNSQAPLRGYHSGPLRQRTESETSSCSSLGAGGGDRTTPLPSQQGSSGNGGGAGVKLHQPWLSPSERKDNKIKPIEIIPSHTSSMSTQSSAEPKPPGIEIRPLNVSPIPVVIEGPSKFSKPSGRSDDENGMEIQGPPMGPPGSLAESPNSKLFSGLTALKPQAEFRQPSGAQALVKDEGKAECNVCGKTFARASQLTLHMNIHYIERPFRCDPCGVSFRTKGHLIKHRRSSSHDCKVYLTEAWGVANEENPRPFKCPDCKIAFRIHGHLAKHLRSKMHIMRMECLGKLPFGIYFEMEKSGINLNEIDTTDCDMSLVSLQNVARKIYGEQWRERLTEPTEEPPP